MQAINSFQNFAAQSKFPREPGRAPPSPTITYLEIALHHRRTTADLPAAVSLKKCRDGYLFLF
ncbi:hypothetical protein D1AOALGA4SA_5404 [Olavius algarvensis Delta 1 endosymbiont]|nr:hypothetical protein D1AOALGA4SA_5404 [Olavius algarvensis Delta 1 endosymbiont]